MANEASPRATRLPEKGTLKRHPFPQLMREIARYRLTGRLYLLSGDTKKVVFFDEGQPVFVRSNVLSECLGQILAAEGLITQEECDQTLEAIRRTGKKQGELLVEMGILSPANLRYGLAAQLRHKLYEVFGWSEGRFRFQPGDLGEEHRVELKLRPEGLIIDGILNQWTEERARESLRSDDGKFPIARGVVERRGVELLPEELHFAKTLDGTRTVASVLESPPAPQPPRCAALLFALVQAGVVQLSVNKSARGWRAPSVPNLSPSKLSDQELAPKFEHRFTITEYEDTPLPEELPKARSPLAQDETEFYVGDEEGAPGADLTQTLDQAESDNVGEGFDRQLGTTEEEGPDLLAGALDRDLIADSGAALLDMDDLDDVDLDSAGEAAATTAAGQLPSDELDELDPEAILDDIDEDELDDIDLQNGDASMGSLPGVRDELVGAMSFSQGELALAAGDYTKAVGQFERAQSNGFDVAELHAMLAFARFMAAPDNDEAGRSLVLLDRAEHMDSSLDLVHAYRGAILRATGQTNQARAALQKALDINPYCEMALNIMDSMGATR